jgi:hypothetical protein
MMLSKSMGAVLMMRAPSGQWDSNSSGTSDPA